MSRKPKEPEIPADIQAMSLEELVAQSKWYNGAEGDAEFNRLLEIRDQAQEALTAYRDRMIAVTRRQIQLLEARRTQNGHKTTELQG